MPSTSSQMLPLGTPTPDFSLPDLDGKVVSLGDFKDARALLVMFVCNHCPFVVHVKAELARLYDDYALGVGIVAINSNDADEYPEDSPDAMRQRAEEWGWKFPYLYDEHQAAAKAYRAACTPDFFLFDADRKLAYRGQLDASRPGNGQPVTGADLRHALEAVLEGEMPNEVQAPSIGCSIKWRPGNAPNYAMGDL
ncbi:MAG: thioredoxin family protein [Armatimonadetes bacterium]|nr:thioredoxin family protein [Armatimonadota bacterium]